MRILIYGLILISLSTPAFAKATVERVAMQVGMYEDRAKDCAPEQDEVLDSCLCEAKIYKPVISGTSVWAAKKINAFIMHKVDPEVFNNFCPGTPVTTNKQAKTNRTYDFDVTFNACSVLAISTNYYSYDSGMAHGDGYSSHFIFDIRTGNNYTYRQLFGDNLMLLNKVITNSVNSQLEGLGLDSNYQDETWIEQQRADAPTDNIWISDKGLGIYFPPYTIAAIARSEMYIQIPTQLLKNADVRKCVEKNMTEYHKRPD